MKLLPLILGGCSLLSILPASAAEIPEAPLSSEAKWIWYPEIALKDQLRFFRTEFQLPEKPVGGTLNFSGDDVYTIWINGKKLHKAVNFRCPPFAAGQYLKAGKNVIAVEVLNVVSAAGLLMRAEIRLPGRTAPLVLVTDTNWKCSRRNMPGWNQMDFDASGWENPVVVRNVTDQHTWRRMIDLRRFLSEREYRRYNDFLAESDGYVKKQREETRKRLAAEAAPGKTVVFRKNGFPWIRSGQWSFPVFLYNSVMLNPSSGAEGHLARFRRFYEAGFRLFVLPLSLEKLWREDGSMDFASVETGFLNVLSVAPEARFFVMIDLNPPEWYVKKYPDELIAYGSGAEAVFSGDHLRLPMKRPSFASVRWREDAGKAVAGLVERLEKSPVGKRIVAFQNVYGIYSEWHYYGMPKDLPDTGKAMTEAFRSYLKRKYRTDENLRAAWHDDGVSLADGKVPGGERLRRTLFALRDPRREQRVLDYLDCHAEVINQCQAYFNRTVRRASGNRVLVGNYSGYFFGMAYPAEGWQTRTPEMFRSDAMDFQAAPYSYRFRGAGACGLPRNVFESYARNGKFSILESDARTHLSGDPNDGHSKTLRESVGELTRDFCNALTRGSGLWYYDFNGGWYDRGEYLALFAKLLDIVKNAPDVQRASSVAYVCDFDSVPYHTNSVNPNEFTLRALSFSARELFYSGVPFDTLLWQDLPASDYKVYLFPNSFHPTKEKCETLALLRKKGRVLIFLYGAGALPDSGADDAAVARFTGVGVKMHRSETEQTLVLRDSRHPYVAGLAGRKLSLGIKAGPLFTVDDPEAEILGDLEWNRRKYPALAVKHVGASRTLYCSIPFLSREVFRNIFRAEGIPVYLDDSDDVLFAGKRLVGLHTGNGGVKTIRLPKRAARIVQLLPVRREFPAGEVIQLKTEPADTLLFEYH